MKLADYSDSEDENNEEHKNKDPPKTVLLDSKTLPKAKEFNKKASKDLEESVGKKIKLENGETLKPVRNIAHIEGNFSSVIYVKVEISEDLFLFYQNLKSFFNEKFQEDSTYAMLSTDSLHISLSKTIFLNFHQIEGILAKMEKSLSIFESFSCSIDFGSIKVFANEHNTRWFFSLLVTGGKTHYYSLIDTINKVLESFKAEKFFKDPQPHLSVAWSPKSVDKGIIDEFYSLYPQNKERSEIVEVKEIIFQIGKRLNRIPLKKK